MLLLVSLRSSTQLRGNAIHARDTPQLFDGASRLENCVVSKRGGRTFGGNRKYRSLRRVEAVSGVRCSEGH